MTQAASTSQESADQPRALWGCLVEFETVEELLAGAEKVRDAGYTKWDCHTPFPVHGLNDAMGIRPTRLPWLVFGAGVTGAAVGLALQYWTNAVDYPLVISGKPLFSLPANIPVIFELTILFAAITAFVGMLALNNLPQWYHALFHQPRFRRVTADRFMISVEARDPKFDPAETRALLESLGGSDVELVED
ncbi:MAG TPA: DUF3341 domain-containing protein [Phycisphaerae bacterium]|nr:DUF3341 domain-containing protein [Phycisphaerae bacterium]